MPYDNTNSGVLFRNDRKETDKHPDYKGSFTDADGREYWLSSWINDGAKGKYMSIKAELKDQQSGGGQSSQPVTDDPF